MIAVSPGPEELRKGSAGSTVSLSHVARTPTRRVPLNRDCPSNRPNGRVVDGLAQKCCTWAGSKDIRRGRRQASGFRSCRRSSRYGRRRAGLGRRPSALRAFQYIRRGRRPAPPESPVRESRSHIRWAPPHRAPPLQPSCPRRKGGAPSSARGVSPPRGRLIYPPLTVDYAASPASRFGAA